jgi:DNA-binding NtrC family response regulator
MVKKQAILLVDDDASMTAIFEFILNQGGLSTLSAASVSEALVKTQDADIRLAFLDAALPHAESQSPTSLLLGAKPNLKIILTALFSDYAAVRSGFDQGAFGVVYKPFDVEEILFVVKEILNA